MPFPKQPIPLPEVGKFVPPDTSRKYFEFAAQLPFAAQASTFSLVNAWWLAEASFAAYGDDQQRVDLSALQAAGFTATRTDVDNVQFLQLEGPGAVILAFRGTRIEGFQDPVLRLKVLSTNWKDLVTDVTFLPEDFVQNNPAAGKVHRGFKQALDKSLDKVKQAAAGTGGQTGKQLWLTGHSLGAALATVAAARLAAGGISVQGVYTYGSPRVGNKAFAGQFPVANTYRFVHHKDIVTTVPPPGLYKHVGHLRFLTQDGQLLEETEKFTWSGAVHEAGKFLHEVGEVLTKNFNAANIDTYPVPFEALADHAPIYYANELWNLVA